MGSLLSRSARMVRVGRRIGGVPVNPSDEPRVPRETRTDFIRRILLRKTEPVDGPERETARRSPRRSSE